MNTRPKVELLEKNRPRQARAKRTYDAILSSAAELLVEVGVERISTNLVAERAGITVPALYRYFPNKYSVLYTLGSVLMDSQNAAFQEWFDQGKYQPADEELLVNIHELLLKTYQVTQQQIGGAEIIQSLRAVGPLQELRLESHRLIASQLALIAQERMHVPVTPALLLQCRLTIDMGYSVVEMALEDTELPAEAILREGAAMLRSYWLDLLQGSSPDT
ncbi:MAG: TetR/AcrR family transcriptional regulator [Halioglobus sp.]